MRYIFADFEMNPIPKSNGEARRICKEEIIEIGAVMLDEDLKEIDSYKKYVRPVYSDKVFGKIKALTGIQNSDVMSAGKFEKEMGDFFGWCEKDGEDFEIYTWSSSDYIQVEREMRLKKMPACRGSEKKRWKDFQKIFGRLTKAENPVSLEKALESIGINFSGKMHDAMWDARNTAELYRQSADPEQLKTLTDFIKKYVNGDFEEEKSTLGDLFDFSKLNFK